MTDDAFIACICANPADDGPRLVYADYLEEQGRGDRAELIRVGIEFARAGPEHRRTGFDEPVGMRSHGPDYWEATCGNTDFNVGDRVDIMGYTGIKKARVRHGLLVMQNRGDGEYILKRDDHSKAWPGESLRARSSAILTANPEWAYDLARIFIPGGPCRPLYEYGFSGCYNPARQGNIKWEWHRGFVERLSLSWESWHRHAAAVLARNPITRVELTTWPEMHQRLDSGEYELSDFRKSNFGNFRLILEPDAFGLALREEAVRLIQVRWPSIEFALPPAPLSMRFTSATANVVGNVLYEE